MKKVKILKSEVINETTMPLGFGISLSQHETAKSYFSTLSDQQKEEVIRFVKGSATKNRIHTAVEALDSEQLDFLA
ncbi:MAG: hypothetical protein N2Z65_03805 [Clostridiales bacterium]|nr:hypothetical protein [Clostridiales bacterium]